MTTTARTGSLPSTWARLHPLSPWSGRAARRFALPRSVAERTPPHGTARHGPTAIAVLHRDGRRPRSTGGSPDGGCHGGELQIDTGLIRRQQVRVPLTRIQGVDLVRPLLARLLGASELRLVLAGHDTRGARLAYLSEERAIAVRAQLLALAHGLAEDTPEPARATDPRRFAAPGSSRPTCSAPGSCSASRPGHRDRACSPTSAHRGRSRRSSSRCLSSWRRCSHRPADRRGVGVPGRRGAGRPAAAQRAVADPAETIPHGRVQAVRWVEPLWWRPFGWVRLEFDIAAAAQRRPRRTRVRG